MLEPPTLVTLLPEDEQAYSRVVDEEEDYGDLKKKLIVKFVAVVVVNITAAVVTRSFRKTLNRLADISNGWPVD